ncbi:MAG: hypothetical protein PWP68_1221 [Rikenellaceae bacterium]|nr:hypothetical protein [Rikenellaceae bacterium]
MLKTCKNNKEEVLQAIKEGNIDAADIAFPNFIDDVILKMKHSGLLDTFEDIIWKRAKFTML